jgi:predicted DNA-binding transcriptional regulator AlpA
MEWTITVATEALEDQSRWGELEDDFLDALEKTAALGVVGYGPVGTLCAAFDVEAPTMARAAAEGGELFEKALNEIGRPARATRMEAEPSIVGPHADELTVERRILNGGRWEPALSASEVASVLGMSRQRVYQLLEERADFPRPVTQTPRGSLWDRRAIEAWKRKPRRSGRPKKAG